MTQEEFDKLRARVKWLEENTRTSPSDEPCSKCGGAKAIGRYLDHTGEAQEIDCPECNKPSSTTSEVERFNDEFGQHGIGGEFVFNVITKMGYRLTPPDKLAE